MALEALRFGHENLERLEAAIAERALDQPVLARERVRLEHEIAELVEQHHQQTTKLLRLYRDPEGLIEQQLRDIPTNTGDVVRRARDTSEYYRRYPNQDAEMLEETYRRKPPTDTELGAYNVDQMFTGEEAYGKYMDLITFHEQYCNLPFIDSAAQITYHHYVSNVFDSFVPPHAPGKHEKLSDQYLGYVSGLADYLERFLRKTKPLQDNDKLIEQWDQEFEEKWTSRDLPGWTKQVANGDSGPATEGTGTGVWCADCQKEFSNQNTYNAHLTGKKHIKAAKARAENGSNGATNGAPANIQNLRERAIASKEFRIAKLASVMQSQRHDTITNIDRKAGLTEKEREAEIHALYAEAAPAGMAEAEGSDEEGDDKVYNPLKLPLAWDGKPIPYWLWKLHGLGQEFNCEICGNYVYMGRRAWERHFNEPRHIFGLKSIGITTQLGNFQQISSMEQARVLWDKLQKDKKDIVMRDRDIVECEDREGNAMPEAIYNDLAKQGII